ncbi:serine/threonine-protein kinase [Streptomyces yaizuensis]|uniref:non-specific serine/threonine protein kinase n=1 Tax=Streptomyces yaizuensis TaxID=2989713 RepID=A0ABQ5P2W1_9ACTN|nr:protein kinase [Streptomyces sp. YSPA8]GLF96934.1 serine/threonine protein kinase [Streptomyces sp. YSPA8]
MNAWTVPGYTESRELGSGTSGRVVLAVHDATGVPVAVKYLAERLRSDHDFVLGLRAEARLLGHLGSPYVVGLYEYVESPHGAAIVMELVDGIALRVLLREEGATGPEAALAVLKGSLLGLSDAHRAGVVHRDYKPENVLVAADGSSKLGDFGIAAGLGDAPEPAGTPSYMAPEQWQGDPVSPAADVYAATVTFFECLTGRKPYIAENLAELAVAHMSAPVPEEEAPEPVRPLIRRGMAKDPADRPASAAAFVAELEEIARAAYGEAWEERGQHRLAALVALLPLLLPSSGGESSGTQDSATTALGGGAGRAGPPRLLGLAGRGAGRRAGRGGRRGAGAGLATGRGTGRSGIGGRSVGRERLWTAGSLCAAAAAAAGLFALMVAAEPDGGDSARAAGRHLATTSAGPPDGASAPALPEGVASPARGSSAPPSARRTAPVPAVGADAGPAASAPGASGPPSGRPTRSRAPGPSRSPSAGRPVPPGPTRTTAPPTTAPTIRPPTSTPPRPTPSGTTPAPARVRSVQITGLEQIVERNAARRLPGSTVTVTAEVTTDGTGPVTLLLTWYTGENAGDMGEADAVETLSRSGARTYTLTLTHTFQGQGCYLGVVAGASPAPGGGDASRQILDRRCASSDGSENPA